MSIFYSAAKVARNFERPKIFAIFLHLPLPKSVFFHYNNIEVPDNSNATHEDILKVSMLLFLNYVDAATAMSESYGGGGGTWHRLGKRQG